MRYLVMEGRYNFSQDADVMFAANDQEEALKPQRISGKEQWL